MPRYFFNVYDGVGTRDTDGMQFANLPSARVEALRLAGELIRDSAAAIAEGANWYLEITDSDDLVLFRLDILVTDAPISRPDPLTGH